MNTINICARVSVVNGKVENHISDNQYAIGTINGRTYKYIQTMRILWNDGLWEIQASDLKRWGLDNLIKWLQNSSDEDLKSKLDWFITQTESESFSITMSNNLHDEKRYCEYSECVTYSYLDAYFYDSDSNEYSFMNVKNLSEFWFDGHNENYYHNDLDCYYVPNNDNYDYMISEESLNDFIECEPCGDLVHSEEMWCGDDDIWRCEHCEDEHSQTDDLVDDSDDIQFLYNYINHNKELVQEPLTHRNSTSFKCGIELEYEWNTSDSSRRNHICRKIKNINKGKSFFLAYDGSLTDGMEIISHPMSYDFIKQFDWDRILKFRGDIKSYNTYNCGIHIHINRGSMSAMQQYKFVQFLNEQSTFAFYLSQRKLDRINYYSEFNRNLGDELKRQLLYQYKQDLENNRIQYSRYKSTTLGQKYYATNLKHSDTIEVRIFRGTLKKRSFLKNIEFVKSVYDWVRKSDLKNYLDFKSYWKFVMDSNDYENMKGFVKDSPKCQMAIQYPKMRVDGLQVRKPI